MAEYLVQAASLTTVADAIRSKGGTSDTLIFPDGFVAAISAIQTGGGAALEPLENPAGANNIDAGYQAYGSSGQVITGTRGIGSLDYSWNENTLTLTIREVSA